MTRSPLVPLPDGWGVTDETARLRDVLLCRPDHYAWQPTNTVAKATLTSGRGLDLQKLQAQYRELEDVFAETGVRCHYLAPEAHLPYQVYTRDSSQMTPWGVVVTQLFRPQRRGEYAAVIEGYRALDIPVWHYSTAGTLEGGDIHLIHEGLMLVGYSGERTTAEGAEQFAGWFRAKGWEVRCQPFEEHFLHMDCLFCMVAENLAVACPEVMDEGLLAWLQDHGIELIPVPYKQAMQLGCNVLALGAGRVASPRSNRALNQALRAAGLQVFDPEFDLFTSGGGGIHCVTMPLLRREG